MKKSPFYLAMALVGLVAVALTGCVSKSRFMETDSLRKACEDRERDLRQELKKLTHKNSTLSSEIDKLNTQIADLNQQNDDLRDIVNTSNSEQQKLNMLLNDKVAALEAGKKKIWELKNVIDRQQQTAHDLLDRLKKALVSFNSDELTIEVRDGKVYIVMSDQLLFPSGSAEIDERGKNALGQLAEVIRQQQNIDIMIEGHTDSVPIRTGRFHDNWDLSVIRATTVTRVLIEDYNVNPQQLIASGRGEYFPIAPNDTPEGKARNRRTEIILSPHLDELFQVIRSDMQ